MAWGFSNIGQISLRNNASLRRSNQRLFLDKENKYPADYNNSAVDEIFREALERENEIYMKSRHKSNKVNSLIKRLVIVFILGILIFGAYQLCVLFSI